MTVLDFTEYILACNQGTHFSESEMINSDFEANCTYGSKISHVNPTYLMWKVREKENNLS